MVVPINAEAPLEIVALPTPEDKPQLPQPKSAPALSVPKPKSGPLQVGVEPAKTPAPVVVVSTNPAAKCLPRKLEWTAFISAFNLADKQVAALAKTYYDLSFGSQNQPSQTLAYFTYIFEQMIAGKDAFFAQAADVKKVVDAIPAAPVGTTEDLEKIKGAYKNSITDLQSAFNIGLQASKVVAEDAKDGYVGSIAINSAVSLTKDAHALEERVAAERKKPGAVIEQFTTAMFDDRPNGCVFVFYEDNTIAYTIQEERDFTNATPTVTLSDEYPPSSATVQLATALPVTIGEAGKTTTVMQLSCLDTKSGQTAMSPVGSAGPNLVTGIVKPLPGESFVLRKCSFVYTGTGKPIRSKTVDVRI